MWQMAENSWCMPDGTLTNLYGVMEDYGVAAQDGIVIEGDRSGSGALPLRR